MRFHSEILTIISQRSLDTGIVSDVRTHATLTITFKKGQGKAK